MPQEYSPTTALVVVDLQNDFTLPTGSLYVPGGEEVVDLVNAEVDAAAAAGARVVYTQDWHPEHTPHFEADGGLWPVHCVAGTPGAELVDGLHLVHSRTSLLDLPLAFWVLVAFACLLLDRDAHRARLLAGPSAGRSALGRLRLWRVAAAVALGLACGVKWSGLYVVAVFAVMGVLWDVGARRAAGQRHLARGFVLDAVVAALVVLPTVLITYLAGWGERTPIATIERTAALIDRLSRRIEDAVANVSPVQSDDTAVPHALTAR